MNLALARVIGAICSAVMVVLAIIAIIYAAGSKLGTIENEIRGVKRRLVSIEGILKAEGASDGQAVANASGLRDGATRGSAMGGPVTVVGLLPFSACDGADGALVLHGNRQGSE